MRNNEFRFSLLYRKQTKECYHTLYMELNYSRNRYKYTIKKSRRVKEKEMAYLSCDIVILAV